MPGIVIVGVQWGDEGKGKATDLLGDRTDWVVKFNGGNNAGHTVVIGDEKYALHLLPSGILSPGVNAVIGNGVVIDLEVLFAELEALHARGVDTSRLQVSANAHIITQYHRTLDKVTERFLGKRQIGTTGRGIGPAYADKINRVGIRVQDLFDENILRQKVEGALDQKNHLLREGLQPARHHGATRSSTTCCRTPSGCGRWSPTPACCSTRRSTRGDVVVFEGGQATMLDVDHGTYPFVTSSSATAGGACDRRRRRPEPPRPHRRHRQGLHDPRRVGPVPDRAVRRAGRVAALARLRVRHHDRPPASRRLVRRADHAVRDAHQRHHRPRPHQARHPDRSRRDPGVRRLRRRRQAVRRGAGQPVRLPPREADPRVLPRLEGGHLRRPRRSRTCRSTRRTTCWRSRR